MTLFHEHDDDGSGTLDAAELWDIFETLGNDVSREKIEQLVKLMDNDGSGHPERAPGLPFPTASALKHHSHDVRHFATPLTPPTALRDTIRPT